MNFKKQISLLFLLLFLVSCNDYEKIMGPALKIKMHDKNPNPVFDGELEPLMPDPKENEKTLLGIDKNNNGIRDDIDIWINRTVKTYNERMALRQLAKAFREEWIVGNMAYENYQKGPIDVTNPIERDRNRAISKRIQETISLEADASVCVFFILVKPRYVRSELLQLENNLRELYKNTELRKEAREAFYHYNHYYEVTEDKKNDYEYCLFKIENLEQTKIDYENGLKIGRENSGYKYDKK